jgi:hypothetical protein
MEMFWLWWMGENKELHLLGVLPCYIEAALQNP